MDVLATNMLDGFVGLGTRFDSHPQLEPRAQHVRSCIDNYRAARLTRSQFSNGKSGNLKDYSAVVLEGKNQQPANQLKLYEQTCSVSTYPDSFYNRHQNDVDLSYAHNFDVSNYYSHHNYRRGPLQHPPQEISTMSTLQLSVAVTSAQILIPATAHTLESEVATASESNTSGTKTSSASGERDRNDNPRIRHDLGQLLQLYHSGRLIKKVLIALFLSKLVYLYVVIQ
ncbi:hypothetical protein QE152_g9314 [Popillia japonica]|uniref:Uncharacterized protein n=1 Tax=Popillia japonica TaxID=7064 RepID=A0AAW1LX85_POPJA